MLATTRFGEDTSRAPLIIAHGLFGSGRNWATIARHLSEDRRVIAVDLRNHGASFWDDSHSYTDLAGDLAEVVAAEGGQADLLGHSMGGKAAMALALTRPDMVARLAVVDIAPVTYRHSQHPYVVAMQQLDLSALKTRTEAETALAEAIPDRGIRIFLLQSLDLGAKRWRLNLDALARNIETIAQFPDFGTRYEGPTLFLRGAQSNYVDEAHRPKIEALFPKAEIRDIPGAGHWPHAEKPDEVRAALSDFLHATPVPARG